MDDLIVAGVGNGYRCDDAAGWAVVDAIDRLSGGAVATTKVRGDIFELMELFASYRRVYLVDACRGLPEGSLWRRIDANSHPWDGDDTMTSTHGLGVTQALALTRSMAALPPKIVIYAVCGVCFDVGEGLTAVTSKAVELVSAELLKEEDIALCMNST